MVMGFHEVLLVMLLAETMHPDQQNWIAALITGAAGVLSHVVLYFVQKRRGRDGGEEDRDERIDALHNEVNRLRRDFENFRQSEVEWHSAVDERLLRIARRLPISGEGD